MSQIFLNWAKQALPWNILCSIGIPFNFICHEMLGGVSDEPTLRAGKCLQAFNRRKPLLASITLAAAQRSAKRALRQHFRAVPMMRILEVVI
jgi:hypothetical protein